MESRHVEVPLYGVALAVLAFTLGGCSSHEAATDPSDVACDGEEVVVEITTADGVKLRADLWPGPAANRPVVVLFHMKPPSYDRSNYPKRIREALAAKGVTVLNVDRRGGGQSAGVAEEAYEGPGALADMEAAVQFLSDTSLGCAVDTSKVMLVGASNGTTSALDYTVAHDTSLAHPAALVWMSPGEYTQNQNAVADHRVALEALPLLWLYPATEDWSGAFVATAPVSWRFVERGEEHGTKMFDEGELEAATLADLLDWMDQHLL